MLTEATHLSGTGAVSTDFKIFVVSVHICKRGFSKKVGSGLRAKKRTGFTQPVSDFRSI